MVKEKKTNFSLGTFGLGLGKSKYLWAHSVCVQFETVKVMTNSCEAQDEDCKVKEEVNQGGVDQVVTKHSSSFCLLRALPPTCH